MSDPRNKILSYAQSAIEGQNIQSQAEYEGSTEREDGVKTGIANGDNFNKFAKQVSLISSSIAEFIVNNIQGISVTDDMSSEQISGYINQAITKLVTENLPPKEPGINVIDESSEIVDFNQLTETGVYYIYKDLLNKPYSDKITYVLTVLNFLRQGSVPICIQLASSYLRSGGYLIPAIVNDEYSIRYGNEGMFSPWQKTVALDLSTNKTIAVSKEAFVDDEISKYMIISDDGEGNIIFKTASRELMRSALGINALGNTVNLETDVEGILGIENGGTGATDNKTAANNILTNIDEVLSIEKNDYIYIYSNNSVKKISMGAFNFKIDTLLPIGFIYFQLRGQSTPDQLFGTSGTWKDISSTYAGEFFRAVGGNSASFGRKQNEGLPTFNIVTDRAVQGQNKVLPRGERLTAANKGLGGVASAQGHNGTSAVAIGTENTRFSQPPFPYFVPNNSIYGASTHVTPYNSAIRIWKKIS